MAKFVVTSTLSFARNTILAEKLSFRSSPLRQATNVSCKLKQHNIDIMKKYLSVVILTILFAGQIFGQSKMVVGQKHTIFVDIPKKWVQSKTTSCHFL
jgi:hypothetical protein